ncbi:MAG: anti-sigma F factor [Cellulosilyticaceae bacterium]
MTLTNEMQICFKSQSTNEAFARVAVAAFFSQLDPTVDELYDVKMAVSEAVTNSIIHGYGNVETGEITIRCQYTDRTATVEISDQGRGIQDIEEAMQPLHTTSEEDERAGLGFTVMQSMMDEVEVSSEVGQGTTVKLMKTFY